MAKKTYQSTDFTSFHGITIRASVEQLTKVFGDPSIVNNTGDDKVNFEWEMETDEGEVFTIYDWKYYRPLSSDEIVTWNIGSKSKSVSWDAERELLKAL
tara:strand:- start:262 stop:558 length:297 start_codon:yes stop_codon:yes gene_type:complete